MKIYNLILKLKVTFRIKLLLKMSNAVIKTKFMKNKSGNDKDKKFV